MDYLELLVLQAMPLYAQIFFLINIYLNLLPLHKAEILGKHLNYGIGLLYAIFLLGFTVHVGLFMVQPAFDQATRFSSFRIFGVGLTLLGLVLVSYSSAANKKLLTTKFPEK